MNWWQCFWCCYNELHIFSVFSLNSHTQYSFRAHVNGYKFLHFRFHILSCSSFCYSSHDFEFNKFIVSLFSIGSCVCVFLRPETFYFVLLAKWTATFFLKLSFSFSLFLIFSLLVCCSCCGSAFFWLLKKIIFFRLFFFRSTDSSFSLTSAFGAIPFCRYYFVCEVFRSDISVMN